MVSSYAKENLTEEQAAVINKSMEEYINSLTQAQKERQNSQDILLMNRKVWETQEI